LARTCSVCANGQQPAIDVVLAEGVPLRDIARRYRISRSALSRHKSHITKALQRAAVSRDEITAGTILGRFRELEDRATTILDACEKARNYRAAIAAVRTLHDLIQSVATLAGVQEGPLPVQVVGAKFSLYKQETNDEVEDNATATP